MVGCAAREHGNRPAGARFEGGRDAVLAGTVKPQGQTAKGAPQFPYDWAVLKAKIEGR